MSDLLRAVTFDVGGRPQVVVDLNDMVDYALIEDTFALQAPSKQQVMASSERRYGGSRQTGETHENAVYAWQHLVRGTTVDDVLGNVTALLAPLERVPAGDLFIESRLDGATHATYREVRATGVWQLTHSWAQLNGARSMVVAVQIQVEPLARALRMDVYDDFASDTRDEYTYDAGIAASEQVIGGVLLGAGTLTTERRAIHTARGYDIIDNRQAVKVTPGTTITGFKAGRVIKRISATTYLEGYVDDTGTVSRVRLDKVIAGVRTNLATTDLAARITAGRPFWLRTTILGNAVTVEHFAGPNAPGPLTAATTIAGTRTQTLAGADATQFGAGVIGGYGRVWIPQHASASLDEEYATPHWSGTLTTPAVAQWGTPIPGDAPALCDATITHSGGSAPPIWALLGWTRRPGTGLAQAPFGILEAEAAGNLSGWSVTANVGQARGDSELADTNAASSDVYTASWLIDPSVLVADDFARDVSIEVWARVVMNATVISPTLTLSVRPEDGLTFGAARYTDEWGRTGKVLTVPTSGGWRFVRLGTLSMLVDRARPRKWLLWLDGSVGAGSSGVFGLDYLLLTPVRQRASSRSGVVDDAGYPDFLSTTSEASKTIRSDLSALIAAPGKWGHPDHGLGGQLLEFPAGDLDTVVKLSSQVPDNPDPAATSANEQLTHTAGIGLSVTPRYYAFRT